jgi:DNA repair exonuclease SbcCD nuclease subunit
MKFTHTADWHIGSSRSIPQYLERQLEAVKAVFAKSKDRGIKYVLVCGDVAEKDLKLHERDALLQTLLDIDDSGDFQTLIISGNHDQHSKGYSALHFLEVLGKSKRWKNTIVASETPKVVALSGQDFLLFPGFFEGKNINKELKKWVKQCKTPPVVLMHEVIKGAVSDSGFKIEHGVRLDPNLDILYFACGDLHIKQKLVGIPHGYYCGSPCQHNFGEELPKGFLIVDTKKPKSPEFVEITEVSPLVTVSKPKEVAKVREDAWVRIVSEDLVDDDELSDRVLKVEYTPPEKDAKADDGDEEVEGKAVVVDIISPVELKTYLRKKAKLKGKVLKFAMKKATQILTSIGG